MKEFFNEAFFYQILSVYRIEYHSIEFLYCYFYVKVQVNDKKLICKYNYMSILFVATIDYRP